ncbi:MAG: hypothetical protein JWS12_383 [Candidatus Saccharibacteria bacterium]|nr:hypothetical protein [Candidatus Saccharibacteria bacterium]
MKTSLRRDDRGMAHVALVLLAVIVIAAIAGIGYYVMKGNKKTSTPKSAALTTASTATPVASANKEIETDCTKLYNDKDFCKFASAFSYANRSYKLTSKGTSAQSGASELSIEVDAKSNDHTVSKVNGQVVLEAITLDNYIYSRDSATGTWIRDPKNSDSGAQSNPADDLKVDLKSEAAKAADKRTQYKKIGKEACDSVTCFKYQIVDPAQTDTTSYIWFGDKDYQLHRFSMKNTDGNSDTSFSFTSVSIKAPSPYKDRSAQ